MDEISIKTPRLLLRQWLDSDLPSLTAMNQDPKVMEFIGPVIGEAESRTMIERARRSWASGKRGINEVVSLCATLNLNSRRVMEKIGRKEMPH